ncbi:MAG: MATE family efflux transporter [Victivallales bacterium]|nr:MATE family efflux transporter [Victivallales bacterium]
MANLYKYDLTQGKVSSHLIRLTVPMLWGFLSMAAFNLTDTYFVSRLGTKELAAMSFTFPVVTVIISIARGLGVGASSAIARALGAGNEHKVKRLATDGLILTVVIVCVFAITGLFTINPLFRTMGATEEMLPMIREYMIIWYCGVAFMFIPMLCNHILRALGSSVLPALMMVIAVVINLILDPLLIFGLCGFPRMGISGAAVATVLARLITLVFSLSLLYFKYRIITFSFPPLRELLDSWKNILHVAIPTSMTNVLQPVSNGFITAIAATFSTAAVASVGAGARIQMFAFSIPAALALIMVPFAGQNWGRGIYSRVRMAWKQSCIFSGLYGLMSFGIFVFAARPLAGIFSDDPMVVELICINLYINMFFSAMLHISIIGETIFNAIGKPYFSGLLGVLKFVILAIPLAFILSRLIGVTGVFWGVGLAGFITGITSFLWLRKLLTAKVDA